MNFKKIKTEKCPFCNSLPVLDRRKNFELHIGEFVEIREFECGFRLVSNPGNETVSQTRDCKRSTEYLTTKKKRVIALERILNLTDSLDVDKEFKNSVQTALTFGLVTE